MQTFFPHMKIARLHSICFKVIVQHYRMLLSVKYEKTYELPLHSYGGFMTFVSINDPSMVYVFL